MTESTVAGVSEIQLPDFHDERGRLVPLEWGAVVPFAPQRIFVVRDVPAGASRGGHAHRQVHQFLVCVQGSCMLLVDDGRQRREIVLDSPLRGVHLAPMVWAAQNDFSPDAALLVLASGPYDPKEYLSDYREFVALRTS